MWIEALLLTVIGFAYWYGYPIRDQWIWLIALLIPVYIQRWTKKQKLWPENPLVYWIFALLALCVVNIFLAPYPTRGWIMIFRPLYGLALVLFCLNSALRYGVLPLVKVSTAGAFLLGIIALTASDWSEGKIEFLRPITQYFVQVTTYPGVEGLFNVNELGGALAWMIPLAFGLVFCFRRLGRMGWHWLAFISTILMSIALLIGQSLSAILGIAVGVFITAVPNRYWKPVLAVALAGVVIIQAVITFFPVTFFELASDLSGRRDVTSLEHRAVMWQTAQDAVQDHPFTGLGMAMFRLPAVWEDYPTPGFDRYKAFHAHNELLAMGTDFGLPGMMIWTALYITAGYMLLTGWQLGGHTHRLLVKAIAGGLIAHAIYGLTDAVPPWDRFAFLFWWMLGLAAAQYIVVTALHPASEDAALTDSDLTGDQMTAERYSSIEAQA